MSEEASRIVTPMLFKVLHMAGLSFPVLVAIVAPTSGAVAALRYSNSGGITVEESLLAESGTLEEPYFCLFTDDHCRHALVFSVNDDFAIVSKPLAGGAK
jgi:hypothetical protein